MNESTTTVARQQSQGVQQARDEMEFTPFGAADRVKLNITIVQTVCAVPTKTGQLPTRQDALRFMLLCRAQRLNPFAGDAFMIGYDTNKGPKFNLITAHQAFLKRAEVHPEFDGMGSGVIVHPGWDCIACNSTGLVSDNGKPTICPLCLGRGKRDEVEGDVVPQDQELVGAWAHVKLKHRAIPTHRRLDLKASRPDFGGPIWDKNPAGMLVKCAEADALRSTFPTLLGGLYTAGEQPIDLLGDNAERSQELAQLRPAQSRQIAAPTQPRGTSRTFSRTPTPAGKYDIDQDELAASARRVEDEQAESAMGLAPAQQAPQDEPDIKAVEARRQQKAAMTPQEQIQKGCIEHGINLDQFRRWASQFPEIIKDADSIGDWSELPAKTCATWLLAGEALYDEVKNNR